MSAAKQTFLLKINGFGLITSQLSGFHVFFAPRKQSKRRSAMRKSLALCAAIALAAGHAVAADLRFPPPGPGYPAPAFLPPALPSWSGCYAGVNVGGAWAHIDEGTAVGGTLTANPAGVAGGGQIGCDIQFDQWVFGIRDMLDATNLRSSSNFATGSANSRNNWFDTLTARQGFLFGPTVLIYAQGGAAWTSTSVTVFNLAGTQIGSVSTSNQGWTLGGGGEWMFAPHWSVFAEYNFMGFGSSNIQDLTAGVNYKF
jgi:outer membrane immunogenic protein